MSDSDRTTLPASSGTGTEEDGNTRHPPPGSNVQKSRDFFITWANPNLPGDMEELQRLWENLRVVHGIAQLEEGEGGLLHIQGCWRFKNPRSWRSVRGFLPPPVHLETCNNYQAAVEYCSKEETRVGGLPIEYGVRPTFKGKGKRCDLDAVKDMIKEGKGVTAVAKEHSTTFVRYHKGIEALAVKLQSEPRTAAGNHIWLWGLTGTGKTQYVFDHHECGDIYIKDNTKWWDGYAGEPIVLIDDFDGKWPFRDFLRLLDKHKYQGQYKGGYVNINPTHIYITCEFPPHMVNWSMCEQSPNTLAQVMRRLSVVLHCWKDGETYHCRSGDTHNIGNEVSTEVD